MKTEVSVVTFCQKGHKLYCPGDIILVMKMKAIAACPMVKCDLFDTGCGLCIKYSYPLCVSLRPAD